MEPAGKEPTAKERTARERTARATRARSVIILSIVVAIAVAVLVFAGLALMAALSDEPEPTSFGPWYPMHNDEGDPALADFENHVPCTLDEPPRDGCQRIKFGIVLYGDAASGEPSTYLMSIIRVGLGDERETHEGTWSVTSGTALDADDVVYRLDESAPQHLRAYWAIGEDLLFLLDDDLEPRVGDAAYGFVLNSIPLGQRVYVPE